MMAEKILGLLSAFVLGAIAGFFYLAYCFKFIIRHMPETRAKIRDLIERYEPQRVALNFPTLDPERVEALRAGYYSAFGCPEALAIELGMRGVTGRCPLCGADRPCAQHPDVMFRAP